MNSVSILAAINCVRCASPGARRRNTLWRSSRRTAWWPSGSINNQSPTVACPDPSPVLPENGTISVSMPSPAT